MTEFRTEISNIHDAFVLEFTRASFNLEELYKAVNSYVKRIMIEKIDKNDNLQADITNLQDICFLLKSFCSEADLNVQLLTTEDSNETIIEEIIEQKVETKLTDDTKLPEQNDDLNKILPYECYSEVFTYSTIDPSEYKVGFEATFAITYLKDSVEQTFFVMQPSRADKIIKERVFRYSHMPEKGIIFGILVDGYIIRAVRENKLKRLTKTFRVLLIDLGEILEISKEHEMYQLPDKFQKIPGQAILCKLTMDVNGDDSNFLENKLHTKQTMRIQRVLGNMLEMIVKQPGKLQMAESSDPPNQAESSDPPNFSNSSIPNRETYERNLSSSTCSDAKSIKNELTQQQNDNLREHEQPLNAILENAADQVPQDDKTICKLANDPETNVKEGNCKLEDAIILEDGWAKKDKVMLKVNIHSKIPTPPVGTKLNLLVSHVVDVEKFYGHIFPENCKSIENHTVDKIANEINGASTKLKPLTMAADEFELVFAMHTDNLWYRAKILKKVSDVHYKVFFVDYGNCSFVTIKQLRKWEDAFDCYPFQAVEFTLDNVTKIQDNHKEAIGHFEYLVLDKPITATVTYNVHSLHVTLQDDSRFDIGEQLCVSKFAQQKLTIGP